MRKLVFVIVFLIFFISCKRTHTENDVCGSVMALKNGEKISYNNYELFRRTVYSGGLPYMLDHLKKFHKTNISEQEIRELMDGEMIKVCFEKNIDKK